LSVVANREHHGDGQVDTWLLLDTRDIKDPQETRCEYHLRTATEERYRQLKCFSNLAHFSSRALSLITNHVVFVLLAYSLIQIYLARTKREDLNPKTPLRIRQQLLPSDNHLIVCWKNYYALFDPYEYTELILSFGEAARRKLAEKSRRMSRQFQEGLRNPRSPETFLSRQDQSLASRPLHHNVSATGRDGRHRRQRFSRCPQPPCHPRRISRGLADSGHPSPKVRPTAPVQSRATV
jgi:hypothetical protein